MYSILNKFTNRLIGVLHKYKIPFFKQLVNKMLKLSIKNFEDSYIKSKPSKINYSKEIASLTFNAKSTHQNKPGIINKGERSALIYYRLMPFFIVYLQKRFNSRLKWAMYGLTINYKGNKFCSLYEMYIQSNIQVSKKIMIDRLKAKNDYLNSIGYQQLKLYVLLRRSIINNISQSLIGPSVFYRLLYLIKMSIKHKEGKEKQFRQEIIKKWRFMSFVKKMAKRKLETMYQNLHSNFVQMTNEVFAEGDNNPCFMTERDEIGEFDSESMRHSYSHNSEPMLSKAFRKESNEYNSESKFYRSKTKTIFHKRIEEREDQEDETDKNQDKEKDNDGNKQDKAEEDDDKTDKNDVDIDIKGNYNKEELK